MYHSDIWATTAVQKQLLFWGGHPWCRALENPLLEIWFTASRGTQLRSSSVPTHGSDLAHYFRWPIEHMTSSSVHQLHSRAGCRPSCGLAQDQWCFLPGVLVAYWALYKVCDPQLKTGRIELQGVASRGAAIMTRSASGTKRATGWLSSLLGVVGICYNY